MKGFDKGVSPVIATILLIALTVAAVGVVAVILSGYTAPPGKKLNVMLTTGSVYHPSKDWDDNKCTVELTNWGPDDIPSGRVKLEFEGILHEDGTNTFVRATVNQLTDLAKEPDIYWTDNTKPKNAGLKVNMWPGVVSPGTIMSIDFDLTGNITNSTDYFEPTRITLIDATTGHVLFMDTALPRPITP